MTFQVGDRCYLMPSTACPHLSFLGCEVIGGLEMRDVYDDFGEHIGQRLGYKVRAAGQEVCAPPAMLRRPS